MMGWGIEVLFLRQPKFCREREDRFYFSKELQGLWVPALLGAIVLGCGLK